MELKRREFLKLLSATTVAGGISGCFPKHPRSLIPYIIPQEEIIPGRSVWYATVCRECPAGCGVTVRVREGRATKAEGNPLHPLNKGMLCARGQASLQGLYSPDRIQQPMRKIAAGGWETLSWQQASEEFLSHVRDVLRSGRGSEIVWLTPSLTGSLDALVDEWLSAAGSRQRYRFEPLEYRYLGTANALLFGRQEIPSCDFGAADTVLSFGADFLETWISPVSHASAFSSRRGRPEQRSRFIYFGPRRSMTAANADEWINVHPDHLGALALAMVRGILAEGRNAPLAPREKQLIASAVSEFEMGSVARLAGVPEEKISAIMRLFAASAGLAVAGSLGQDGGFQNAAGVGLLNYVCGNVGRTVNFGRGNAIVRASSPASIAELARKMEAEEVSLLLVTEANPAFTAPATGFARAAGKVPHVVSFSPVMDETTALASLVLPIHTSLESWGDDESLDGIHGLMQPVVQPVFPTRMLGDLLLESGRSLFGQPRFPASSFHDYVQDRWKTLHAHYGKGESFEAFWVECLARGGVWEEPAHEGVRLNPQLAVTRFHLPDTVPGGQSTFTLLVYPSVSLYDGRGANKPWLQELPDPMTRLDWGSWAELHPDDAGRLGLADGDSIRVSNDRAACVLPVRLSGGVKAGCIAIPLGQGHHAYGRFADGIGVNAFALLAPAADGTGLQVHIQPAQEKIPLASVQKDLSEHGRKIAREIAAPWPEQDTLEQRSEPSLYPPQEYARHQWGMAVDIDKCTGCAACVAACYAENNIPVVGKEDVMDGRIMAWLRIDRYEEPDLERGRASFLPMFCQQCGDAPCETVCPVYAAYHTEEGLNGQVYNRCIGTRYCANNCPYKVRRFNWFEHRWPEPLNSQLNPDVTVRSKGVMEKCTFCIQRIVEGKNNARMDRRNLTDGEIRTACEQTCPSQAITFGDLKDPGSRISSIVSSPDPRAYHVLEELNTRPAVTYLKKITHGV